MDDVGKAMDGLQVERSRVQTMDGSAAGKPLVVFMTPSIDHKVTIGFLKSFIETTSLLGQNGWAFAFQSFGGDPYLSKVRNLCVSTCLKRFPTAQHLFFLDADLEWDAKAVLRMVNHPAPIVAGIYCKKSDPPDFPCTLMADEETGKLKEKDGLLKASMVPTGFLRVKREVYMSMAAQSLRYKDSMGGGEECWNIFEMGFAKEPQPDGMDGQWYGEDCAWCRKAIEMGYDVLVDPEATFGHLGNKTWRFEFGPHVQAYKDGKAKVVDRTDPGSDMKVVGVEGLLAAD